VVEVGELPPPQQQQQDGEGAQLHQEEEEGSPLSFGQPTHHSQRSLAATAPPTPLPFGTMATVQPTSSSPEAASVQRPQQAAAGEEGAGAREGGRLLPAAVFGGIRIGKGATEQQLRNLLEQQQRRREQLLSSLLSASTSLSPGRAMKSLTPRLLIRHQQHLAGHPTAAAAAEAGGEQTPLAVRSRQGVAAAGGWQGGSATPGKSPGPSPCWSELSFQQGLAGRVYTPAAAGRGARGRGFLQRSLSLGDLSPFQASTNPAAAVTPEKGEAEGQRLDAALTLQDSPAPASASAARESAALPLSPVSPLAAALLGSGQLVRGISGGSVSSRRVSRDMQALDLSSSLELASNPLALAGLAEQLAAADADVMELQLMAAEVRRRSVCGGRVRKHQSSCLAAVIDIACTSLCYTVLLTLAYAALPAVSGVYMGRHALELQLVSVYCAIHGSRWTSMLPCKQPTTAMFLFVTTHPGAWCCGATGCAGCHCQPC
jgi:hypothetical protein